MFDLYGRWHDPVPTLWAEHHERDPWLAYEARAEPVGPHVDKGPRGYRRDDRSIREEVCERLLRHGRIDPSDLEIRVDRGEVTLEGTVGDRDQKRLVELVAERVRGVTDVHNRLRIALPFETHL